MMIIKTEHRCLSCRKRPSVQVPSNNSRRNMTINTVIKQGLPCSHNPNHTRNIGKRRRRLSPVPQTKQRQSILKAKQSISPPLFPNETERSIALLPLFRTGREERRNRGTASRIKDTRCAESSMEEEASSGGDGPGLMDLTEDTLVGVLSFLTPKDLFSCSRVCRPLHHLCSDDGKVWLPLCERRWGSFTDLRKWGNGRINHRLLYSTLSRWENLIGFWRGVGTAGCGFLTLFEWAPNRVVGYKIVPSSPDSYSVRKIPFLWMGISGEGQIVCLLDPSCRQIGKHDTAPPVAAASFRTSSADAATFLETGVDAFGSKNRDVLLVDVHFVGNNHLVVEEITEHPVVALNELAQAVTIAAFGQSHNLHGKSPSPSGKDPYPCNSRGSYSSSSESESYASSPPGSFQYEVCQFLVNKVTGAGSERAARKQRRRDKGRLPGRRRWALESEHFVKVIHASPTESRPLQGLWKGFFDSVGLDFVLVSYNDKEGEIICRKVQDLAGAAKCGSVLWTSLSTTRVGTPLAIAEQARYDSCIHIQPSNSVANEGGSGPAHFQYEEEVIGMQRTSSCCFQSLLSSDNREGRIWLYADGSFGFSHLHTNSIIDFRAMCTEGCLLDSIE